MKNLLIFGLAAALAYVLVQRDTERRDATVRTPAPASRAAAPAERKDLPDTVYQMAREQNKSAEEIAVQIADSLTRMGPMRLWGNVEQHTSRHLIVRGAVNAPRKAGEAGVFALYGHPDSAMFVDGKYIDCQVCVLGTTSINLVDFARILKVQARPRNEKPGDWMYQRSGNPLDRQSSRY